MCEFEVKNFPMILTIRLANSEDVLAVAKIHSIAFTRQSESVKWVACNLNAYPRIIMFVAESEAGDVIGYIQWLHKSGFRKEAVIELEQIAVLPEFQGNGIGAKLINDSLIHLTQYLVENGSKLKAVLVTTRSDNAAQKLYKRILGADIAAIIKNLYSYDEVIMLARFDQ
jgi:ribosomal protein S18 acetylase RimI-like enzyme